MDCRITAEYKFRTKLEFKKYDVILTKKQLMLTKIKGSFKGENMQTRNNLLGYRTDLYFHGYKLTINIDENGNCSRKN